LIVKGSAAKRHRQSQKRRLRNRSVRSEVHTETRKFLAAVSENDAEAAGESFLTVKKLIDSAIGKGVIHKNTGARKKSRLHKKLNALTSTE
jgi:small subunit ribosomal protein S20